MEKQLTITDISAKFTKDFDSFGKMDPYLEFILGKNTYKTQTAQDQGKTPKFTSTFTITYLDETQIEVKSYDVDVTQNQYMGTGKIDLNALKASGEQSIQINDDKGSIGTVTFKYELKKLAPTPFLIVKNIHCQFLRQAKFILSSKPYLEIVSDQNKASTNKKQGDSKGFDSSQTIRIKVQQKSSVKFNLLDDNQNGLQLFSYQAAIKEFRQTSGKKQFNVNGKDNEPLGILKFEYETLNFVTKEQSAKNAQKQKKQENQLTSIQITKIKGNLTQDGNDIYFKILVGSNLQKTTPLSSAKRDFVLEQKIQFYAESKQNKITFVMYDKDMTTDDCLGSGILSLDGLSSGQKTVTISKHSGASIGSIIVTLNVKKVQSRSITLSNIQLKTLQSHDMIGQQEPYIIARIGGWSGRTQTGQGKAVSFKKSLTLKYSTEEKVLFEVWEQDVTNHQKLSEQIFDLNDLILQKGTKTIKLTTKDGDKVKDVGTLSFKYQIINPKVAQKKAPVQKKIEQPPIQKKIEKQPTQKKIEKQPTEKKIETVQQKPQPSKVIQEKKQIKTQQKKQQKKQQERKLQTVEPKGVTKDLNSNKSQSIKDNQSFRDNASIDKSKNSFKLPNIVQNPHNYGDKIFDKQSAATLQKSILVYSMPKAPRFGSPPKYSGQPSYYVDSCFKPNSGKGVGFGFGYKRQFPQWLQRNMKENPAPGAYIQAGNKTQFRVKGPTFGISHKYYQKVTIPKQVIKTKQPSSTRLKPIQTNKH